MRGMIAFEYPDDDISERYIVINKINSTGLRPLNYEEAIDKNSPWIVSIETMSSVHTCEFKNYSDAVKKYNEILDAIDGCKC